MITFISPEQFKTIPWKNGLGVTTELAISEKSTLANFSWRLSIATVTEDGFFSNFSGYDRNLVLIKGDGITLTHQSTEQPEAKEVVDTLDSLLMMSSFDGGCKTYGSLSQGEIKDFNIMTSQGRFKANVTTLVAKQTFVRSTKPYSLYFAYSLSSDIQIQHLEQKQKLPVGHLLKVEPHTESELQLTGENIIFIELIDLTK